MNAAAGRHLLDGLAASVTPSKAGQSIEGSIEGTNNQNNQVTTTR
jgi:hypothetical protein